MSQLPLPHEKNIQKADLPDPFQAINDISKLGGFRNIKDKSALIRACHNVISIARNLEYKKKNSDSMGILLEREKQELIKLCSYIERSLLACISFLEKNVQSASKNYGKTHNDCFFLLRCKKKSTYVKWTACRNGCFR